MKKTLLLLVICFARVSALKGSLSPARPIRTRSSTTSATRSLATKHFSMRPVPLKLQ